jgi:hypothetical protein
MKWNLSRIIQYLRFFYFTSQRAEAIYSLLSTMYREPLLAAEKQQDPRTLTYHGYTAYSQADEDGILDELFRRIGLTNGQFLEFGCGNGLENNSTYLLFTGWRGVWIDGDPEEIRSVEKHFQSYIESGQLKVRRAFITTDNINELIREAAPDIQELDLLSIDVNGNDYWFWQALTGLRPRVVAIEYNATFRPPHKIVQKYNPTHNWDGTNYFGASLKALEELGREKGYALTGCSFAGANAFFIREDLVGDRFSEPFTAEHHYRPPRYDAFVRGFSRHPRGAGPYQVL